MTQRGEHTWDLVLQYHRCPKCGFIIESREGFHYRLGKWVKDLVCDRCGNTYEVMRILKPSFGPLIGPPQPPEFDWTS